MLSRKTWFVIAFILIALGVWHGVGSVEYVYSVRHTEEGVFVSKITCGNAFEVLLLDRYHEEVLGPATGSDCDRASRTRMLEVLGVVGLGLTLVGVGVRYGADPPTPIDEALPRLPKGDRVVEGRRRD